jgi:hypothetical protein
MLLPCVAVAEKPYESAFSSAAWDSVQFDVDIPDTFDLIEPIVHELHYREPGATSWTIESMEQSYAACSVLTLESTVLYDSQSEMFEWYIRSEADSAVATQSPKNASNTFPVPDYLLADVGADPVGDAVGTSSSHLDITHAYVSYSDTKVFVRLDNAGGGFPTSSGFDFFLYAVGLVDPNATDSVAFAMVYVNVPFLMSPGLYKIDAADSSFSKFGDIGTNISGNSLSMSCNISSITSQPEWSEWPPPSGFVGLAPVIITQTLTGMTVNDLGKIAIFVPQSQTTDYASNSAPALSGDLITDNGEGSVSASVTYTDSDDNTAVLRNLHFGDQTLEMTACVKDYQAGTMFEANVTADSGGWYDYYFEFSDGAETATTSIDSIFVDLQTFVPGDADGSGDVDIDDVVYLIEYIFSGGPAPDPIESGDGDCSGSVDIDDAVYLILYIFSGGPPPC